MCRVCFYWYSCLYAVFETVAFMSRWLSLQDPNWYRPDIAQLVFMRPCLQRL